MDKPTTLWECVKWLDKQVTIWLIKLLAFYYAVVNYIKVHNGYNIVSYKDVNIDISLVYKGKIAPLGYIFYIAKIKIKNTKYSKNMAIYRKNISDQQENILKLKTRIIFANMVTKQINK